MKKYKPMRCSHFWMILVVAITLSVRPSYAQETSGEQALAILPFKYPGGSNFSGLSRQFESLTYEKFVKGKRVELVEREYFSELENEKWRQSEIDFVDGTTIAKTKARGAKYLLIGQVNDFKNVQTINDDGTKGNFSASASLTIRVINAETSKVEISGALSAKTDISDLFETTTETGSTNAVVKKMEKKVSQFINENWPLMGKIVQAAEEGGNKLKAIIAKLGNAQGVAVGEKYLVIERQEKVIDGEKLIFDAKLGEAQLTQINGEKLSTFRILSGGDEIQKKMGSGILYVKMK